jgi:hypothetical protein
VTLRAHYPYRQFGALEMSAYLEVPVRLKQREEAYLRLLVDPLEYEIVAHVLVPIEHIRCRLSHQDNIDKFLGGIPVLREKRVLFHVHVVQYVLEASR